MTILTGDRLFEYLSQLEQDLTTNESPNRNLREIIQAEKLFLQKYYSLGNEPSLAFSGNGLPSADSLNSDLETMCKLSEENELFKNVSQKYKKDFAEVDTTRYDEINSEEYSKRKKEIKKKTLNKESFSIGETKDRALRLARREEIYIDALDDDSQTIPIAVQDSATDYRISHGELMYHTNERIFSFKQNAVAVFNSNLPARKEKVDLGVVAGMGKKTGNFITKTTKIIGGLIVANPTIVRKLAQWDDPVDNFLCVVGSLMGGIISSGLFIYLPLNHLNPKAIPYVFATQLTTNVANGLYEWYRHEKNKKTNLTVKEITDNVRKEAEEFLELQQ